MTAPANLAPVVPESAPFSSVQRAWLNGFFAGLLSGEPMSAQPTATDGSGDKAEPEEFPWHDPTLSLADRLQLAEGRSRPRVLMAAMAQLDCGQCGYLCQTYGEALAGGSEARLSLCVPGGKETARKLKELMAQAPPPAQVAPVPAAAAAARPILAPARFEGTHRLNGAASEKDTRHVVFHLNGSKLDYEVGDSFGIQAQNCRELVQAIVDTLAVPDGGEISCPDGVVRPLRLALTEHLDIARPSEAVVELLAMHARDRDEARRLKLLVAGEDLPDLVDPDLLDLLRAFPSARPPAAELARALGPLQPRLYSIASSPKAHPGQVHLTVGVVRYERNGRPRKGVASTFLAERAASEIEVPVFVQKAHGFRLPEDPTKPVIMIGPGTGIAPFRAFLEERRAVGAKGWNWLFFGEQRRDHDFLYRDEIEPWHRDGFLTRLDTAFSRDQSDKIYVQNRMRESAAELWAWLEEGAHVYVCGDAKRMARDVDLALQAVVAEQGGMTAADARAYVAGLTRDKRYQRDVY